MRMMDELKHMYLYSSNKSVHIPIDEKDKRRNSAILLLTPNIEVSSSLMKLPYIYNPNLFTSFYIDRNVMAYIDGTDNIDFDENEEESISEAMLKGWTSKVKFKFDEDTSVMDKNYIEEVLNYKNVSYYARILGLNRLPESINIVVHPNAANLQNSAPKQIQTMYKDKLYSYSVDNNIHVLSKFSYDPKLMGGPYNIYLATELVYALIMLFNPDLHFVPVRGIAGAVTDQIKWIKNNKSDIKFSLTNENKFAYSISKMIQKQGYGPIIEYIRTGKVKIFADFIAISTFKFIKSIIFESELSYFERQRLLPSEFGIPEKRKYPMPDEEHVRAAIRMFNNCDPDDEKELADAIIKKMKKFGVTDIKVSAANRFRKYYNPSDFDTKKKDKDKEKEKNKPKMFKFFSHESAISDDSSFEDSEYADIMQICDHLSQDELKKITFYDTYRNSKFVIKRIIAREDGIPAGFLDVYCFPSNPGIAQIVIAVDNRFRGRNIGDRMVKELMNSNIHESYNFSIYYWTAHQYNYASQNLALKNGFVDTNKIDKYGRKIFIKRVSENLSEFTFKDIPDNLKPIIGSEDYVATESSLVTNNMAIFYEANDDNYSQRLRKYLYSERIKNNKGVLELYDKIRASNPEIKRMYINLKMYKKQNVFVDLSYYHALFLKNNIYKADKAVDLYFDFLLRLINNKEINSEYNKRTIFIPVNYKVWNTKPNTEVYDFRNNLNPISIIFRLIRTNPAALKRAFGNEDIIFVGSRGYFKIDFNSFELRDLNRLRTNINKLMSNSEPIEDDYDIDSLNADDNVNINRKNIDSPKAMTAKMIDRIENNTDIKIDNISSTNIKPDVDSDGNTIKTPHLSISKDPLNINISVLSNDLGAVVITIDPDGPSGYERINKNSILSHLSGITSYCKPY